MHLQVQMSILPQQQNLHPAVHVAGGIADLAVVTELAAKEVLAQKLAAVRAAFFSLEKF